MELSWVRRIAAELPECNSVPLFGNAPPFDWEGFSKKVGLHVSMAEAGWKKASEMKKGLGSHLLTIHVNVAPIGPVLWMTPYEDMGKLASWMMAPKAKTRILTTEVLQEGFYYYFVLQALLAVQDTAAFEGLSLQISEEEVAYETAFCLDVEMRMDAKRSAWGRLAIPKETQSHWIRHFSTWEKPSMSEEMRERVFVDLGVQVGKISLQQSQWEAAKVGDFVLLDRGGGASNALLTIRGKPLFHAKVKEGRIELADAANYYEDQMEKQESVPLGELSMTVTVEMARLNMTLERLVRLEPGNTLELPVHPDQSVALVVNGQQIGRGELVHLGEQLGVRILEIG